MSPATYFPSSGNPFAGTVYEPFFHAGLFILFMVWVFTASWKRLRVSGLGSAIAKAFGAAGRSLSDLAKLDPDVARALQRLDPLIIVLGSLLGVMSFLAVFGMVFGVMDAYSAADMRLSKRLAVHFALVAAYCVIGTIQAMMFLAAASRAYGRMKRRRASADCQTPTN